MLFSSYIFILFFLPIVLSGYFALGKLKNREWSCAWMVVASLFFYGWWNEKYLFLILGSVIVNYSVGEFIRVLVNQEKKSKLILIIGIIANLGVLAYFKYTNFLIANIHELTGVSFTLQHIILPIGLSFFTFEQIAYLVDTYRGKVKHYHFLDYCYFVTFFPRLIAGPIIRHNEVLTQIERKNMHQPNIDNLAIGFSIFFIGLFKKVIMADSLAAIADPIFQTVAQGHDVTFLMSWLGALAYTAQLYFDFSGYSDMAIGLARIFGIVLPLNFNSPYKSTCIIDFWRNWNISLSRFLRDYLYLPLGGNRKGHIRRYVNLVITMLLGGLWHGANWTFVMWGGLHGFYLLINHFWRSYGYPHFNNEVPEKTTYRVISWLVTFIAVVIGWVFFRADTFSSAFLLLKAMVNLHSPVELTHVIMLNYAIVGLSFSVVFILPNIHQLFADFKPTLDGENIIMNTKNLIWRLNLAWCIWKPSLSWGLSLGLLFIIATLTLSHPSIFIYYDF